MSVFDPPAIARRDIRRELAQDAHRERLRLAWKQERISGETSLGFDEWRDEMAESGALADFFAPEGR